VKSLEKLYSILTDRAGLEDLQKSLDDLKKIQAELNALAEREAGDTEAVVKRQLAAVIEPVYPKVSEQGGRPPLPLERMLRVYFLQIWFNLSDPAVEEALYDSRAMRTFVGIDLGNEPVPYQTTVMRFRHLPEEHKLGAKIFEEVGRVLLRRGLRLSKGTIVDATIIASASKSDEEARWVKHKRKPAVHGFKAHVGADAETALVEEIAITLRTSMMARQAEKLSRMIPVKSSPTAPIGEKPFGRPSAPRAARRASWRRKFGDATCRNH
jgi:hypothetical protein